MADVTSRLEGIINRVVQENYGYRVKALYIPRSDAELLCTFCEYNRDSDVMKRAESAKQEVLAGLKPLTYQSAGGFGPVELWVKQT